jgi:hypothetical protein
MRGESSLLTLSLCSVVQLQAQSLFEVPRTFSVVNFSCMHEEHEDTI